MAHRRKSLSQNFLRDTVALRTVVRASGVRPADLVVEPGAGEGTLTRVLARRSRQVIAYEIDRELAARLPRRLGDLPNVRVVPGDFLHAPAPPTPFTVVGNIPYSRTTDIVRWCLNAHALDRATLVTQLEYARKRTGGFGTWPLLTVQTWPAFAWRLGPRLRRELFTPVPRTDSALLHLDRRAAPLLPARAMPAYRALVAQGFTGVGGSLYASLCRVEHAPRVRRALDAAGVPYVAPVGHVSPAQWLTVFRHLHR
ncbi:23S ribosomal RNA methyltransferase Erm [Streptomyces avicenniae]|uniref:23S ribosomal RNA methyltransferase Erm n=1 Tax=Streptomyces avicenniae TaxID=500153 RepID=UPI00069961A2|nr:23S ribosomal RNA methyltransferase Erm [Streptomyces avicenniae]